MTDANTGGDRDIWIGDVLKAWGELGPHTPQERADVAEALGFDASAIRARPRILEADEERPVSREPDKGAQEASGDQRRSDVPNMRIIPSTIEEVTGTFDADVASSIHQARELPREESAHHSWRPAHVPLLQRQWTRHITSAITAVHVTEGALDESRLIDAVSRLRPVRRLPRLRRRTLRRGLQLLLDRGPAMLPFTSDVQDIVASVRTLVARDQLEVAAFEYTPAWTDANVLWLRQRRWDRWRPPAAGTPILLVTDLGLSQQFGDTRGASVVDWLEFASRCRAAGCAVAALVPRGEAAWPPALRNVFTIIPWDRRTDVSTVLRLLRQRTR